eukprot:1268687-Rhodomonas_salina.1
MNDVKDRIKGLDAGAGVLPFLGAECYYLWGQSCCLWLQCAAVYSSSAAVVLLLSGAVYGGRGAVLFCASARCVACLAVR